MFGTPLCLPAHIDMRYLQHCGKELKSFLCHTYLCVFLFLLGLIAENKFLVYFFPRSRILFISVPEYSGISIFTGDRRGVLTHLLEKIYWCIGRHR